MKSTILRFALALALSSAPGLTPSLAAGVEVGTPSALRNLVPAEELERQAATQYGQLKAQASAKGALAPDNHPQVQRLRAMAQRMIPFVPRYNPAARNWQWEVNLLGSKQANAFCMPGGKIAFYTGLLEGLQLTDDEAAMVMGHEIAHALREHARERIAKTEITHGLASLASELLAGSKYGGLAELGLKGGASLLTLKFSRDDETEADVVGLDLAARAGFDPRAAVTLWRKMGAASKGAPPQWLSTHPAGRNRIAEIERQLPQVLPVFEEARRG
ncbi:MAG: M48 family metallopeptidase [Rhodocyclaceae bacterium]|jgi:Zn-dependent protease with chaperone function|nr:M48 family metallopeptidase [Rhodocyclaceae bacterium]